MTFHGNHITTIKTKHGSGVLWGWGGNATQLMEYWTNQSRSYWKAKAYRDDCENQTRVLYLSFIPNDLTHTLTKNFPKLFFNSNSKV